MAQSMADVLEEYQKEVDQSQRFAPDTRRAVVSDMRILFSYMQEATDEKFGDSVPDSLLEYENHIKEYLKQTGKRSTKARRLYTLRLLIKYMADKGLVPIDTLSDVELTDNVPQGKVRKTQSSKTVEEGEGFSGELNSVDDEFVPARIISSEEVQVLIDGAMLRLRENLETFEVMLLSALLSGIKTGDLNNITWDQIEIESPTGIPVFIVEGRRINLSDRIPVKAFVSAVKFGRAAAQGKVMGFTPSAIHRRFHKMLSSLAIGSVSFSDLRWRCKVDLVKNGISSEEIATILGITPVRVARLRKALEKHASIEETTGITS